MSATSEQLAEQIRDLDGKIADAKAQHFDVGELETCRKKLVEQLNQANEALNEGKVLKG